MDIPTLVAEIRSLLDQRVRDTAEIERLREALAAERGAVHGVLGHLRATAAERDAERARADKAEAEADRRVAIRTEQCEQMRTWRNNLADELAAAEAALKLVAFESIANVGDSPEGDEL